MHNLLFVHIPTQTVEVSLNYLYYQCHISGERLHGKRCVNTFPYLKSTKKQFYQRYREKMFSFYTIWFGLYRIYTFGVSYLFLMVVLHLRYLIGFHCSPFGILLKAEWGSERLLAFLLADPSFPHISSQSVSILWGTAKWLQHPYLPVTRTRGEPPSSWDHCGSHRQSLTSYLHRAHCFVSFSSVLLMEHQAQAWAPSGNYLVIRNRPRALLRGEAVTFHLWRPGFQGCLKVGGLCLVNIRYFSMPRNCMAFGNITWIPRRNRQYDREAQDCGKPHVIFLHRHHFRSSRLSVLISVTSSLVEIVCRRLDSGKDRSTFLSRS